MTVSDVEKKKPEIKYRKLADSLRDQIRRGELKPGDRLPTLSEMYELERVSRTTVERVHRLLENDGLVVCEQGRGTFVAGTARRPNGLIGVSGFGFEEEPRLSYWTQLLEGLQQSAARDGQALVLLDHATLSGWDRVDGVILADPVQVIAKPLRELPAHLPRVSVLFPLSTHASVVSDDYYGGRMATEHLLSLGHRKIACIMDREKHPTRHRFAGYKDALAAAGVEFDSRWARDYGLPGRRVPDFMGRGREIMQEWLDGAWRGLGCTGMVVQNDLVAVGVINVLQDAGIEVPAHVSIVGYDNLEICDFVSPRLTSVETPHYEIAVTAMEILIRQIETGRRNTAMTVVPAGLRVRNSTAVPHSMVSQSSNLSGCAAGL